jgi:hypothetical protein
MKFWVILNALTRRIIARVRGDLPKPEAAEGQIVVTDLDLDGKEAEPAVDPRTDFEQRLLRPDLLAKGEADPETFTLDDAVPAILRWIEIQEGVRSGQVTEDSMVRLRMPDGETKRVTVERYRRMMVNLARKSRALIG